MKVWFPTIRAGSGADVFTKRLVAALAKAGWDAEISWIPQHYEPWPEWSGVKPPADVRLVHANSWSAHAFARHGLPVVVTEHGYVSDPEFLRTKSLPKRLYHLAVIRRQVDSSFQIGAAVTAVSQHVADAIRPSCPRGVSVIHNWIDTNVFRPGLDAVDRDVLRVLYAGTRARHKGFDVVQWLAGYANPGIEIWCAESLRPHLRACRTPVRFFEKMPAERMPRLYANCDVALVPSRYEGFGYIALEAMACARPVVGFACQGLAEVCGDEAGILVPIDDRTALRDGLMAFAKDRRLAQRMGSAGRQRAVDRFGEAKAIAGYLALYERLLS